ncbi:MAG: DUF5668 domain-containing protein [Candidatus Liptonbacteria bacterium]|nr:DUF5668 domain-containing protein [Candidatus Liptonbacteria bacterium]
MKQIGIFLIVLGGLFLLKNMGILLTGVWSVLWPIILIAWGVSMFFRRSCGEKCKDGACGHWWCCKHWQNGTIRKAERTDEPSENK